MCGFEGISSTHALVKGTTESANVLLDNALVVSYLDTVLLCRFDLLYIFKTLFDCKNKKSP